MANVLQVNGVVVPGPGYPTGDAWVLKIIRDVVLSGSTGLYVSVEYKWPTSTQLAWQTDGYIPPFFSTDLFHNLWAGPGYDFNYPGGDWENGFAVIQAGDVTPDVWHTFEAHFHDLTGDARVDGGSVATDVVFPDRAGGTDSAGVSNTFGTTANQKQASPFSVGDTAKLDLINLQQYGIGGGSPADNVVLQVCDDAGGSPGTVLDTVTQAVGAGPDFTFTGGVTLTGGTTYWLVIGRSGSLSNSNYYQVGVDQSGNGLTYNGTSWVAGSGIGFTVWTQLLRLFFGEFFTDAVDNTLYIRRIKIGTSGFGSSDLFDEDWAAGNSAITADFDDNFGDLVVIPEPGAAPFTLSVTPVALSLPIPGSGHVTVISTMVTGPPEDITLSVFTSLPTGVTAGFSPNPITDDGGTSTLTFTVDGTASPDDFDVVIQGDDGAGGTATTVVHLYLSSMPPGIHIAS